MELGIAFIKLLRIIAGQIHENSSRRIFLKERFKLLFSTESKNEEDVIKANASHNDKIRA